MFRSLNLGMLSSVAAASSEDAFLSYERSCSGREGRLTYRKEELDSVSALLKDLGLAGLDSLEVLDGFAYSYRIPQILEEFDLLRVSDDLVLNIELKSRMVSLQRIEGQLRRKRYYLNKLARPVRNYTYVAEDRRLYRLDSEEAGARGSQVLCAPAIAVPSGYVRGRLVTADLSELLTDIEASAESVALELDALFDPRKFLISPILDVEEFLAGEYFLTQQQDAFKASLVRMSLGGSDFEDSRSAVIEGGSGVGKTLLLFDVAKTVAQLATGRVIVVHCESLQPEHVRFNAEQDLVSIVEPCCFDGVLQDVDAFDGVALVCFDEALRVDLDAFRAMLRILRERDVPCIVVFDSSFPLGEERLRVLMDVMDEQYGEVPRYCLSSRMRSSREIVRFNRALNRLGSEPPRRYEHVRVTYASSSAEADELVSYWRSRGYEHLSLDAGKPGRFVGEVAGLEFDDVALVLDGLFSYSAEGKLVSSDGGNAKMILDQALCRVRRGIALVIKENRDLLDVVLTQVIAPGLDSDA